MEPNYEAILEEPKHRQIEAYSALEHPRLRGKPAFSHVCEEGCGRRISWNKKYCLTCLNARTVKEVADVLL